MSTTTTAAVPASTASVAAAAAAAADGAAAAREPLKNEFTFAFPKFAKAKGMLVSSFRVNDCALTLHVFAGGSPTSSAAASSVLVVTPGSSAVDHTERNFKLLKDCEEGWVGCSVVNCSAAPVVLSMRLWGVNPSKRPWLHNAKVNPNCRASIGRLATRDNALTCASENGGCLILRLALDVHPAAAAAANGDDNVHRLENGGCPHLRFLPPTISNGYRDLRSDLLDAYVAAEDGVSGDFEVAVAAAAAADAATDGAADAATDGAADAATDGAADAATDGAADAATDGAAAAAKCENEEVLVAHKFILSARSPVLRAMLASTMSEANCNRMEIAGHSAGAVHGFVRFLYSDTCEENTLAAHDWELLQLADKYDVPALRRVCESWLGRRISAANAIETLRRADANNAPTLKRKAIEYVAANKKSALGGNTQAALRELGADLLSEVLCAITDD